MAIKPIFRSVVCLAAQIAFALILIGHIITQDAIAASAKVALVHSNPVLGDTQTNVARLNLLVDQAFKGGAKVVVMPELATTGFSITRDQVLASLGFSAPYPELITIESLAKQYKGCVAIGIAEVAAQGKVFNSIVLFGPSGRVASQEKRGLSGWHDRGELPFEVFATPFGELATIICSDSYLPDWVRIVTLKGADIVVLPANWWGSPEQTDIWATRARENGIWFLAANRWGSETDTRFGEPFVYDMSDAASAVIAPSGEIKLKYRAQDNPTPADKILFYTLDVPDYRIGSNLNPVYFVNFRKPEAYQAIRNTYYRPDLGNQQAPDLPSVGVTRAASFAYKPSKSDASANLEKIVQLWKFNHPGADILVLPGLGVSYQWVDTSNQTWYTAIPWSDLQSFVNTNGIGLLVTTVAEKTRDCRGVRESLLLLRAGSQPTVIGQIHDSYSARGTGKPPVTVDLLHARVGVLLGRDALFPEIGTALAKTGIDLLVISSSVGSGNSAETRDSMSYFWSPAALQQAWNTITDHVFHLVSSDWTGNGAVIENSFGVIGRRLTADVVNPAQVLDLDSGSVRTKFLNAYYQFDLDSLLGAESGQRVVPREVESALSR